MIEIIKYKDFSKWFDNLKDRQAKARINVRLKRLALGNMGDCKALGGSLYELRMFFGQGYRIYFSYKGDQIIILLRGGNKITQQDDIKTARKIIKEECL